MVKNKYFNCNTPIKIQVCIYVYLYNNPLNLSQ